MGQALVKEKLGIPTDTPVPMADLDGKISKRSIASPLSMSAGIPGLDVSGWQADPATYSVSQVDWHRQWALGARYVYTKATEGNNFIDASRTSHLRGASSVGMLRGAYHFALPNQSSAISQADHFVNNGGTWTADGATLPPLLDIENNPYGQNCYNMAPGTMVAWINDFSQRVKARTGRLPMIYTNYYWWQECTGNSSAFINQPLHIAAYGASSPWVPGGWKNWSFWQFSSTGPLAGDSNVWNGTVEQLNVFARNSGTVAPTPPAPSPTPSIPSAADLVAADSAGTLWNYPKVSPGAYGARKQIGHGWGNARSLNVIDWDADGTLDILAQWKSGALSVYRGVRTGGFAAPLTLASQGWADYQLTVGYWLNSSNRPQILAKTGDGYLKLFTTSSAGQISGGSSFSHGWSRYNLTMVDFDGDKKQDLLAQDPAGDMYLYRSTGTGGFVNETRRKIGHHWQNFTSVTVSSDFTAPGSVGLLTRDRKGLLSYYAVPGNSKFVAPVYIGHGWTPYRIAGGDTINP